MTFEGVKVRDGRMTFEGVKVLVTGANGLIGSRLVRCLLKEGAQVQVLVRSGLQARHFQQPECRAFRGDITDPSTLTPALKECSLVFQCAWSGGSWSQARSVNVEGACNVVRTAAEAGVKRLIHLSTMVVHGQPLPSLVTEELPLQFGGGVYAATKAEGERAVRELGSSLGLELVVIRPSLVYGPGSKFVWRPFLRVKNEEIALLNSQGLANLVYIDDLIQSLLSAARMESAKGEAFLISGKTPVTWSDYIGSFSRMCGKPLPPSLPLWRARVEVLGSRWYSRFTRRPRRLTETDLMNMTQSSRVSISKAQEMIDYNPQFSLLDGMRRSEKWLREAGYLRPACNPR